MNISCPRRYRRACNCATTKMSRVITTNDAIVNAYNQPVVDEIIVDFPIVTGPFNLVCNSIVFSNKVIRIETAAFEFSTFSKITLGKNLKSIGRRAFADARIHELVIPANVTIIKQEAFASCSDLTTVRFMSNSKVKRLPQRGFQSCCRLVSVVLPHRLRYLGHECFSYCFSLASIVLPDSVSSIGDACFRSTNLNTIRIPPLVTVLPASCFQSSRINQISWHDNISSIGKRCFMCCSQLGPHVVLPNKLVTLHEAVFYDCARLESVTGGFDSVTSIGSHAFALSHIKSFTFPRQVSTIQQFLFSHCPYLYEVELPHVLEIAESAFSKCASLKLISCLNVKSLHFCALSNCSALFVFHQPDINFVVCSFLNFIGNIIFVKPSKQFLSVAFPSPSSSIVCMGDGSLTNAYGDVLLASHSKHSLALYRAVYNNKSPKSLTIVLSLYRLRLNRDCILLILNQLPNL